MTFPQTAKMKLLPSLFSCVYSRGKLFVFAMNSRRRYPISVCFIYGLKEKNSKSEDIFAVCRLPAVNVMLNLSFRTGGDAFTQKIERILCIFF